MSLVLQWADRSTWAMIMRMDVALAALTPLGFRLVLPLPSMRLRVIDHMRVERGPCRRSLALQADGVHSTLRPRPVDLTVMTLVAACVPAMMRFRQLVHPWRHRPPLLIVTLGSGQESGGGMPLMAPPRSACLQAAVSLMRLLVMAAMTLGLFPVQTLQLTLRPCPQQPASRRSLLH